MEEEALLCSCFLRCVVVVLAQLIGLQSDYKSSRESTFFLSFFSSSCSSLLFSLRGKIKRYNRRHFTCVTADEVVDVTPRYTNNWRDVCQRRHCNEDWLSSVLQHLNAKVTPNYHDPPHYSDHHHHHPHSHHHHNQNHNCNLNYNRRHHNHLHFCSYMFANPTSSPHSSRYVPVRLFTRARPHTTQHTQSKNDSCESCDTCHSSTRMLSLPGNEQKLTNSGGGWMERAAHTTTRRREERAAPCNGDCGGERHREARRGRG